MPAPGADRHQVVSDCFQFVLSHFRISKFRCDTKGTKAPEFSVRSRNKHVRTCPIDFCTWRAEFRHEFVPDLRGYWDAEEEKDRNDFHIRDYSKVPSRVRF